MNDLTCQKCGSLNLRKLSLVYESGRAVSHSTSSGAGIGIGFGGIGVGVGGGSGRTTTHTTTSLRAAPPPKKRWGVFIGLAIICMFLTSVSWVFWLGPVVFGFLIRQAAAFDRNVWPSLYRQWDASYLCDRCGCMGIPQLSSAQITTAAVPDRALERPTIDVTPVDVKKTPPAIVD